ncbi:MAG TPA: hypothetical protein VK857_02395, partial [Desulforhopalus sp.]|nr:hypothetical protein [Desulforhopalus sp.]
MHTPTSKITRTREWLLSDTPASATQAAAGRDYLGLRLFWRNRLAVLGLAIIAALVVLALFAPQIAPYDPIA